MTKIRDYYEDGFQKYSDSLIGRISFRLIGSRTNYETG